MIDVRPNLSELVSEMKGYGASEVVTEQFAASHNMKDLMTVCAVYIVFIVSMGTCSDIHTCIYRLGNLAYPYYSQN